MSDLAAAGPVGPATDSDQVAACECMYDSTGHQFRSRCICPPPMTPDQTLRAVAGLGGAIGDAVGGLLAEITRLRADRDRYRDVAKAAEALVNPTGDDAWVSPKLDSRLAALSAAVRALASTTTEGTTSDAP